MDSFQQRESTWELERLLQEAMVSWMSTAPVEVFTHSVETLYVAWALKKKEASLTEGLNC